MSEEQMRRALEIIARAKSIKKQFDTYVLIKRDGATKEEFWVGEPHNFRRDELYRMSVQIPEEARRYVFRLWRKDIAHKFNECVRELNQLGASHSFTLIKFSPITGEPS